MLWSADVLPENGRPKEDVPLGLGKATPPLAAVSDSKFWLSTSLLTEVRKRNS